MLKDDIILDTGEDETPFLEKYKDVMEDLFRQIVDIGSNEKIVLYCKILKSLLTIVAI